MVNYQQESNSACNHTSDKQNQNRISQWEPNLFNHEYDYTLNWTTQSSIINYSYL